MCWVSYILHSLYQVSSALILSVSPQYIKPKLVTVFVNPKIAFLDQHDLRCIVNVDMAFMSIVEMHHSWLERNLQSGRFGPRIEVLHFICSDGLSVFAGCRLRFNLNGLI